MDQISNKQKSLDGTINIDNLDKEIVNGKDAGSNNLSFWFVHDDIEYLFKSNNFSIFDDEINDYQDFGALKEVYTYNLAKELKIKNAEYTFARSNSELGVITPSILKKDEKLMTISDYTQSYNDDFKIIDLYNRFVKNNMDEKLIYNNIDLLIKYQIINVFISQYDNQNDNICIQYSDSNNYVQVAKKFDNANSFSSHDTYYINKLYNYIDSNKVTSEFKSNYTMMCIFENNSTSYKELINSIYNTKKIFQ